MKHVLGTNEHFTISKNGTDTNVDEAMTSLVYDVSTNNPTAGPNNDGKFTLGYILDQNNVNTLIPTAYGKGGMSIKFVQSSDDKYVQYRYIGIATTGTPNPFLDTANWREVEDATIIVAPVNATDATLPITTLTTEVGKYYRIDVPIDTLAVALPAVSNLTTVRTVVIYLTAGSTPNVTFVSSESIKYQSGFAIQSGKTYEINARWNGSSWIITSVEINIGGTTIVPYKISGGYNNTITNIDTEGYSASVQFKDSASAYNARIGASCVGGSNFASPYTSDKKHIVEVELTDDDTSNIDLYLAALSEEITENSRFNTFNLVAYATVNTGTSKRLTLEITDNYSAIYLYTTSSGWNTIKIKSIECKIVNNE